MQFTVRQMLLLTALVAMHFMLRSWWLRSRLADYQALIPVIVALVMGVYCGARTLRPAVGGTVAGVAAMLSAALISVELMLESSMTGFARAHQSEPPFLLKLGMETVEIFILGFVCGLLGAAVCFVMQHACPAMAGIISRLRSL